MMNLPRALTLIPFAFGAVSCTWLAEPKLLNERQTLDFTGISKLEVVGIAGNFSVKRGQTGLLTGQGVGRVSLNWQREGTTLRVSSSGDTNCYPCTVDIEVQVVQPLELALNASNGNVTVTDAATNAELKSGNGSIRISGATNVTAKTGNGEIYAAKVNGKINLSSNNGKITLENAELPVASQNSINTKLGDIRINGLKTANGFVITGNSSRPVFALSDFELKTTTNTFIATRAGANPTILNLETNNGTIHINP